jgi:hypothetical protein
MSDTHDDESVIPDDHGGEVAVIPEDHGGDLTVEQVDDLLDALRGLRTEVRALKGAATADAEERRIENIKRDKRIAFSQKMVKLAIIGMFIGIVVGASGLIIGLQARATTDDILSARSDGRHSVCDMGQTITNSLINASKPPTSEDQREATQKTIDQLERDLEEHTTSLGCDFNLLPAKAVVEVPPQTTVPGG